MNLLLLLYLLVIAPKLLLDRVFKGKRHPGFSQRLGFSLPSYSKPTIWIHAVSLGEVKAASALLPHLKKKGLPILLSTTTATGFAEAEKLDVDFRFFLPLDFSFITSHVVRKLNPKLFFLIESDFWPNLLRSLRKQGARIALVNGKMSARSFKRFSLFPTFTKRLFSHFDHILLQDASYLSHFLPFANATVTGNLKLDLSPQTAPLVPVPKNSIVISCTHPGEEEAILSALLPCPYFLLLAPRHPERFETIASLLKSKNIPFSRFNDASHPHQVLLVDQMGVLPSCYKSCRLALLGGSFLKTVGGHNPIEPALYHTPTFIGPYTHNQQELTRLSCSFGAAKQLSLEHLRQAVDNFFANPAQEEQMRRAAKTLTETNRGSAERAINKVCG
jgi:3-deoxy-D-manno-octulosonic-acid transferase